MGLNKVLLSGRCGRDVETRSFADGGKLATFTLATDEVYNDRNGNRQTRTEWHNIVLNGRLAETGEKLIQKGTSLFIEGKIKYRNWEDQNGQKHYMTEIHAISFELLTRRDSSEQNPQPAKTAFQRQEQPRQQLRPTKPTTVPVYEEGEQDLPF